MRQFDVGLKDKVVVITGAGGVICSALSKAFASFGAKVALLDRAENMAKKFADEIVADGGIAKGYFADVLDKTTLDKCREKVLNDFGACDILINGAGGNNPKAQTDNEFFEKGDLDSDIISFFDLDKSGVQFVFDLNFMGTLIPTQVFAQDMTGKKGCCIINISSMNAFTPLTKIPAYSAAKAAVSNFTKWLAVYFSKAEIRVNAIAPGFLSTAQNKSLLWNDDGTPTERTGKIIAATPMGRFGEVDDLIGATLFLASPKSAGFITGVVLPIDGGFSSYSGV